MIGDEIAILAFVAALRRQLTIVVIIGLGFVVPTECRVTHEIRHDGHLRR